MKALQFVSQLVRLLSIRDKISSKSTSNEEKDGQSEFKTHQPEFKTHQLAPKTYQLEEFLEEEKLPSILKSKIEKLNKRSKNEEVRSVIYALCSWKPLTAQEIEKFLNRKDKKYLVTQYLTPLIKDGKLKYIYPERGNSPNQAYTA